jgi:hypothetical protein
MARDDPTDCAHSVSCVRAPPPRREIPLAMRERDPPCEVVLAASELRDGARSRWLRAREVRQARLGRPRATPSRRCKIPATRFAVLDVYGESGASEAPQQ